MRKAKLLEGKYGVYAVFDKVSKHYNKLYFATTDEEFVRKYLPEVFLEVPLRDLKIYKIGIFDDVTAEIKPTVHKIVKTDCYLFPHSRLSSVGDDVKLEDIENAVITTKNEILAAEKSVEENNKKESNENE